MKEAKIIIKFSFYGCLLTLVLSTIFYILKKSVFYDINMSILTGLIVSLMTSLCQYFVIKYKIKNNIFNYYFDIYKEFYACEKQKKFFKYNVFGIYTKINNLSIEYTKNINEYSGFIPHEKDKLYNKLVHKCKIDYKNFNGKNLRKLLICPLNEKNYKKTMIPIKEEFEKALCEIDKDRFNKEYSEYKELYNKIWEVEND